MNQLLLISLTLSLGSHHYPARENASYALGILQPEAYLVWAAKSQDAEMAARARKILDTYYWEVSLKLRPTKWHDVPWLDSLPYTYPERYPTINTYLWLVGGCPGTHGPSEAPIWGKYRKATQLFLYHQLKAGRSKADLVKLLDAMVEYEKGWILKNQHSYQFSSELLEAAGK